MFTFGREHERECVLRYLPKGEDVSRVTALVDGVHDYLDGKCSRASLYSVFATVFSEGGSGAWEQAGSWLRRFVGENTEFQMVWRELAAHRLGKVRFRVACFINEMPPALAKELGSQLAEDCHKKTREMAQARLDELSDDS
ncbi:hypothetical protein [Bythopirellula goksoeyrii]|uniref:Uncharacterized protein n=1 Tax=Bythopirellula goksoeyrii TaxID=1400387 RepID=A0A5B9QBP4_9BACT|nr:hypothetical protein [Bythopirellula goksoeyrii]QEG34932.1 hypothetical protein Pr1d_22200 [Bythopirellula goksoeyrii]